MSTAVSMEPLGSTQQLRWVAVELTALTLWFRLAFIRHDNVCFVWFHAYVRTWFANNHNRFGGGAGARERGWPSSVTSCAQVQWIISFLFTLQVSEVHILVSDGVSLKKEFFLNLSFVFSFGSVRRSPGPETGGASAGAGELLGGWQYLRWHRGQRGQLETQHTRPQCCLRYKSDQVSPPTASP